MATWLVTVVLLVAAKETAFAVAAAAVVGAAALLARSRLHRPGGFEGAAPQGGGDGVGGDTGTDNTREPPSGERRTPGRAVRWLRAGAGSAAALPVCVAAAALSVGFRLAAVESGPVRALAADGGTAVLTGVVTGDPRTVIRGSGVRRRETVLVPVRVEEVDRRRGTGEAVGDLPGRERGREAHRHGGEGTAVHRDDRGYDASQPAHALGDGLDRRPRGRRGDASRRVRSQAGAVLRGGHAGTDTSARQALDGWGSHRDEARGRAVPSPRGDADNAVGRPREERVRTAERPGSGREGRDRHRQRNRGPARQEPDWTATDRRSRPDEVVLPCHASRAEQHRCRASVPGQVDRGWRVGWSAGTHRGEDRRDQGAGGAVPRERVRVPVLVLAADAGWKRLVPSQRIQFTARLGLPRQGELLAAIALVRGPPKIRSGPSPIQRAANTIRDRLRRASDALPADQRAVLPGLVDGDTSRLPPDLADAFRTAGLSHLLAVSGGNLAIAVSAVLAIGRWSGAGRRGGPVLAALAIVGFVIVARPSASVLRAAVMGLIALAALVTGRERHGIPALCAAVLILTLADPALARSYGFILSALATAGILVLAPTWRDRLSHRMPGWLAGPLAVAAAAQVACAPALVLMDGEVSLVALPANLLAAPAVPPATLLGIATALAGPVSPAVARLLVLPAGLAVGWITWVARTTARMPFATVAWWRGFSGALLLVVALVAAAVLVRRTWPRRIGAAVLAGAALVVLTVRCVAPGWPPPGWAFVACDVGQGDGLALSAGPRRAVVIDAGPDPPTMDRCLRDLRVSSVPLLVLTHPHADHIGGVPGVLHGRSLGTVLTSPNSDGMEQRPLSGRPVTGARVGDSWTVGPVTLTVLGPRSTERVSTRDDGTTVNNASVVLFARRPGLTVLLNGDVEVAAQHALLAAGLPSVDVFKTPHHGSANQDPAFFAASHARIAVTSVGARNDYGHPAPQTMALAERLGMRGYRTDRDGDIAIVRTGHGLGVVTRRHST